MMPQRRKRNRINKERVDINAAGTTNLEEHLIITNVTITLTDRIGNNNSKPNGNNNQGGGKNLIKTVSRNLL